MKKVLLLFAFLLPVSLLSAQEVEEVQMTLITKRTATWCPLCGGYGWTMFRYLLEDNSDKALLMAAHYGGSELETPTSTALSGNFIGGGQPKFFVNNDLQSINSGNIDDARITIKDMVDANYQLIPQAAFGLVTSEDNGTYTINGKVKFLEEMEGDFYLSVYVVEKTRIHFQASQGEDAEHKQLLTYALTDGDLAEPLVSGTIATNTEYTFSFNMTNVDDVTNMEIIAILWDKEDTGYYTFINGNKIDLEPVVSTSAAAISEATDFGSLRVLGTGEEAVIELTNRERTPVQLQLFDAGGQQLHTFFTGELPAGTHQFTIPDKVASGMYFVRIIWQGDVIQTARWVNP